MFHLFAKRLVKTKGNPVQFEKPRTLETFRDTFCDCFHFVRPVNAESTECLLCRDLYLEKKRIIVFFLYFLRQILFWPHTRMLPRGFWTGWTTWSRLCLSTAPAPLKQSPPGSLTRWPPPTGDPTQRSRWGWRRTEQCCLKEVTTNVLYYWGSALGLSWLPEGVCGSREEAPLQVVWRGLLPPLFQPQDAGAWTRLG